MVLGDLGADVVQVDPSGTTGGRGQVPRSQRLPGPKDATDREGRLALVGRADMPQKEFRPGVAERLGVEPGARAWLASRAGLRPWQ